MSDAMIAEPALIVQPQIPCGECLDSGLWGTVVTRATHQLFLRDPGTGEVIEVYTCPSHAEQWATSDWLYLWCALR